MTSSQLEWVLDSHPYLHVDGNELSEANTADRSSFFHAFDIVDCRTAKTEEQRIQPLLLIKSCTLQSLKPEQHLTISSQGPFSGCFGALDQSTSLSGCHGIEDVF